MSFLLFEYSHHQHLKHLKPYSTLYVLMIQKCHHDITVNGYYNTLIKIKVTYFCAVHVHWLPSVTGSMPAAAIVMVISDVLF